MENKSAIYESIARIVLPENILDIFDITNVEEERTGTKDETGTEVIIIHFYLDERDMRDEAWHDLTPNGFTEPRKINDFPIRDRKVVLHVRRRRWIDFEGHNVILTQDKLVAEGTSYSKEFADALKKYSDTYPIPVRSLERYYKVDGHTLEYNYKEHLSGYRQWDQIGHASDWVLLPQNMGTRLSLDESMHAKDLFTFLTNKGGHGKKGTLIAAVRGTKAEDVQKQLLLIPEGQRLAVEEVTMDFSDSMYTIATKCFPNAMIVVDCFHIIQRVCDGINELRMRFKRKAATEQKKEEAEFNKKLAIRKRARERYRRKHPRKRGEKRGRPRLRANEKFKPLTLSNGDTKVELLTRARYILPKSGENWSENQKKRASLMFGLYPKFKEGYSLVSKLRAIFRDKSLDKESAKSQLHDWYKEVSSSGLKEIISARDCIKSKEDLVLNYFINRSTNAAAESFNSKAKAFRSELRGVRDIAFYLYRCTVIFG